MYSSSNQQQLNSFNNWRNRLFNNKKITTKLNNNNSLIERNESPFRRAKIVQMNELLDGGDGYLNENGPINNNFNENERITKSIKEIKVLLISL